MKLICKSPQCDEGCLVRQSVISRRLLRGGRALVLSDVGCCLRRWPRLWEHSPDLMRLKAHLKVMKMQLDIKQWSFLFHVTESCWTTREPATQKGRNRTRAPFLIRISDFSRYGSCRTPCIDRIPDPMFRNRPHSTDLPS